LEHPTIDVNSRDSFNRAPLHIASYKDEKCEIVKLLLQHPSTHVNAHTHSGMTPFHVAARFACPKVVQLLLNDTRVKVDAKTIDG
jgi:ankyrin repeat protein